MSILEWKKIDLVDFVDVHHTRLQNLTTEITAQCCNTNRVGHGVTAVLCDRNGFVHVLLRNLECISFKSQSSRPIKLCALTTNDLLATVTQNEHYSICIHVYDLKKLIKRRGAPAPCIAIGNNLTAYSLVTSIQAEATEHDKILAIGIGFEKGNILLHYGLINRDLSINQNNISTYEVFDQRPITGIQFEIMRRTKELNTFNMFVTCIDAVFCFVLSDKGVDKTALTLVNERNVYNHCCTMHNPKGLEDSYFVVGRDDAIYCFTRDGRGPCYAIEGKKRHVSWVGHHLVIAVETQKTVSTPKTGCVLIVVDTENKIIVFNKQIDDIFYIITGNASCYIITMKQNNDDAYSYKIYKLEEYETSNQVRLLMEKHIYDAALRILERGGHGDSKNAALVRFQYGNYLLEKGDVDRAIAEYMQTIGVVKPYDIISRLVCSKHNEHLIQYLNMLVKSNQVTNVHKQLLSSCTDRKDLSYKVQELCAAQGNVCDLKNITVGPDQSLSLAKILNLNDNENLSDVLQKYEEIEILNFFIEAGEELISDHSKMALETIKSLLVSKKTTHAFSLLSILNDHAEFCSKLLTEVIKDDPACNEKYYYYLLVLYLCLWRDNKMTSDHILEFLKNSHLRLEQVLIICRVYLFSIGIRHFLSSKNEPDFSSCERVNLHKCIEILIKNNPDFTTLFEKGPRSLLLMLQSLCNNEDTKVLHLRSFFMEQSTQSLMLGNDELQFIASLNTKLESYGNLLSNYKENPIEFRKSSCDSCRQALEFPSVYFLCQHSYHKHCLSLSSNNEAVCVACSANPQYSDSSDALDVKSLIHSETGGDIIQEISKMFATGIFKSVNGDPVPVEGLQTNINVWQGNFKATNVKASSSKNPFDEEFDSNSNWQT